MTCLAKLQLLLHCNFNLFFLHSNFLCKNIMLFIFKYSNRLVPAASGTWKTKDCLLHERTCPISLTGYHGKHGDSCGKAIPLGINRFTVAMWHHQKWQAAFVWSFFMWQRNPQKSKGYMMAVKSNNIMQEWNASPVVRGNPLAWLCGNHSSQKLAHMGSPVYCCHECSEKVAYV